MRCGRHIGVHENARIKPPKVDAPVPQKTLLRPTFRVLTHHVRRERVDLTEFTHFLVDSRGESFRQVPIARHVADLTLHKLNGLVIDRRSSSVVIDVSMGHCAVLSSMFFIRYHWSI